MTPDDRPTDLKSAWPVHHATQLHLDHVAVGSQWSEEWTEVTCHECLTQRPAAPMDPFPPARASLDVRADAFTTRVFETAHARDLNLTDAINQTYRDHDRIMRADETAPSMKTAPLGAKLFLAAITLILLAVLIPLTGLLVTRGLVPLWQWAFPWL